MFFAKKHILSIAYKMKSFQQKRNLRNIIYSRPVLMLLSVLVLFFAWNVLGFWNKMEETSKNKKIAEDKIAKLEQQKEKFLSDINDLKTDQGKEKIFRENFGLAKEGENLIVIVEEKNLPTIKNTLSDGFFSFLKNWFK